MPPTRPSFLSSSSSLSLPPMLSVPAHVNSTGGVSSVSTTFTDSSSRRDRRTFNASEFVFSIDDDGRGARTQDDAAILEYFNHQYRQQITPTMPLAASGDARGGAGAPYGFFHGNIYGTLRDSGDGRANTTILTQQYAGYVLSALASGYVYAAVEYVLMRLDPRVLGLRETHALQGVLDLQWAVVLFLGLLSDAFAPFGLRRNAYIISGWISASVLWTALFVLFQCSERIFGTATPPSAVATVGITAAVLALVVATNALDIRVIELSQHEELRVRGRLVATYQSLRIGAQVVVHVLVLAITSATTTAPIARDASGSSESSTSARVALTLPFDVSLVLLHLALVALVPIPFLLHYAREERVKRDTAALHLTETCKQFWQCAQQKVIWHLVAFNCVLYFFTLLDYSDASRALSIWTDEAPQTRRVRSVVSDVAFVAALVAWKYGGVNACWIRSIAVVIASWSAVYFTANTLIAFDVARVSWIPMLLGVLRAGLRVLLLLSAFVPTIEVAQLGSEGTIYGLLSSFQSIAKVLGSQLSRAIRDADFSQHLAMRSVANVQLSDRTVEWQVFYAVAILTGAKLLALLSLAFCPQQKLDAQQLRIYGGYSKLALVVFLSAYAMSYPAATYLQYRRVIE